MSGTKISSVIFSFAFSSQELKKLGLGSEVDLQVYEVPVEYQTVQSLVPSLWKQYHPLLVVHVGVSGMTATVTLEKCGRNHGYKGLDNSSFCPDSQCCIVGGPDCIDSVLDIESVAKRVTASGLGVAVSVSKDCDVTCDLSDLSRCKQQEMMDQDTKEPQVWKKRRVRPVHFRWKSQTYRINQCSAHGDNTNTSSSVI
uniref:Pyroglutamyl-peptidase I n=1 Tax=Sphaeramia orbicularis TaxID=375764 RepID=A0A672YXD0_9TELE